MPSLPHITEAEWIIMARLWGKYPLTVTEILSEETVGKALNKATVRTLLRRLVAKKAVGYTSDVERPNLYYYHPLVCEQDCVLQERRHFLELYYKNNAGELLADFAADVKLPAKEVARLKKLLDKIAEE